MDNCVACKISKSHSGKIQAELHSIPKIAIPWHTLHIDATGKLSGKSDRKEYVFVLIDAFTKYVLLHHTVNIDTLSSIAALRHAISLFGAPKELLQTKVVVSRAESLKNFVVHTILIYI